MKPTRWRDAIRDSELDGTAKLVAYTLSTYMNGVGTCYPSRLLVAKGCGKGETTVDRAIRRLERARYLVVVRSTGRTSNRYEATLPNPLARDGVRGGSNPLTNVFQPPQGRPPTPSPTTRESELKASESVLARADERAPRATRAKKKKTSAQARALRDIPTGYTRPS